MHHAVVKVRYAEIGVTEQFTIGTYARESKERKQTRESRVGKEVGNGERRRAAAGYKTRVLARRNGGIMTGYQRGNTDVAVDAARSVYFSLYRRLVGAGECGARGTVCGCGGFYHHRTGHACGEQ